jgi:hypothetical protein
MPNEGRHEEANMPVDTELDTSPDSRTPQGCELALICVLAAWLALHLAYIGWDAFGGLVSNSGDFFTDEGFWLKSAKLYLDFGVWANPVDVSWYSHSPLYTLVMAALGGLFGLSLEFARVVSVLASIAGVILFYWLCRTSLSRRESLYACLLVAWAADHVTFSRVAFLESIGSALSLASLLVFMRLQASFAAALGSLLLGAIAYFFKNTFVFTLLVVMGLWTVRGVLLLRDGQGRRGRRVLYAVLVVAALVLGCYQAVVQWAGEDYRRFHQVTVEYELQGMDARSVLKNELRQWIKMNLAPWRLALALALAVHLAAPLALGAWRKRRPAAPSGPLELQPGWSWLRSRAALPIGIWGAVGTCMFGLFSYQPTRWSYFTIFPFALLAVAGFRGWMRSPSFRSRALFLLLLVHLGLQARTFIRYASIPDKRSTIRMAQSIAERLMQEGPEVVIIGNHAMLISLFAHGIRPITFGWGNASPSVVCERVEHWWPRFFVGFQSQFDALRQACPSDIRSGEVLQRYDVLQNYMDGEPSELIRISYADGAQPLQAHDR